MRYLEQLIDGEQTASLALLLKYAIEHLIDGKRTVSDICNLLSKNWKPEGCPLFPKTKAFPAAMQFPVSRKFIPALTVSAEGNSLSHKKTISRKSAAPTRKTGGSTDGYKPFMLGQRLKALAFALLQPLCF